MPHTRLLRCFVLHHSVIKTKHLKSLVPGFKWVETLGWNLSFVLPLAHSIPFWVFWSSTAEGRQKKKRNLNCFYNIYAKIRNSHGHDHKIVPRSCFLSAIMLFSTFLKIDFNDYGSKLLLHRFHEETQLPQPFWKHKKA